MSILRDTVIDGVSVTASEESGEAFINNLVCIELTKIVGFKKHVLRLSVHLKDFQNKQTRGIIILEGVDRLNEEIKIEALRNGKLKIVHPSENILA